MGEDASPDGCCKLESCLSKASIWKAGAWVLTIQMPTWAIIAVPDFILVPT